MNPVGAPKNFFSGYFAMASIAIHCDGHIFISFVYLYFTSFHSVINKLDTELYYAVHVREL